MTFSIELRARASQNLSIEIKHNLFVQSLVEVSPPWGIKRDNMPQTPDAGSELVASFNLGNFLGKVAKGHVYYQFRRPFRDEASHDDFLDLTFNPNKTDFRTLAYEVFPEYLAAFDPYVGTVTNDEFSHMDYEALRAMHFDARHMVFRISQVAFFDALLCQRAFKLSPEMVAEKLKGVVEHTRLISTGILIIGSSSPLNLLDADRLSREWRQLLN
jgi:hypothetical protein